MNMTIQDVIEAEYMPPPPPWYRLPDGRFCNDVTNEVVDDHPMIVFQQKQKKKLQGGLTPLQEEVRPAPSSKNYHDFRCEWQEVGLHGAKKRFGLTIRYHKDDMSTSVKLDGVDGQWQFSTLEGPHGPINEYDLFVGAKVKVFGRMMSITSASASTCMWIESEKEKMVKLQDMLQMTIEKVGAVPVVRRRMPMNANGIGRRTVPMGSSNLRRLFMENARLGEQIANLGLAGVVLMDS